jgi:hypothetical protein
MQEIWKDIPGYEGLYQVSNYGNILTLSDRWGKQRLLKNVLNAYNYYQVNLSGKLYRVHQLVAMAFLSHKPNGYETVVNHIDNNPLNNRLDNLELVSNRYNSSCHRTDAGVSWDKRTNKWKGDIRIWKTKLYLGRFTDKQEALDMYQLALANIHLYNGDNKEFRNKLKTLCK